jgi:hypothetical protein
MMIKAKIVAACICAVNVAYAEIPSIVINKSLNPSQVSADSQIFLSWPSIIASRTNIHVCQSSKAAGLTSKIESDWSTYIEHWTKGAEYKSISEYWYTGVPYAVATSVSNDKSWYTILPSHLQKYVVSAQDELYNIAVRDVELPTPTVQSENGGCKATHGVLVTGAAVAGVLGVAAMM